MILLLFFAFLAGLVTILAPCIWPLLPIILSVSVTGKSHRKPLGVTLGIMVSFAVFTLAISYLVRAFHFDPNILRIVAVVVIGLLGITMIIPAFSKFLEGLIARISSMFGQRGQKGNGFGGGFVTGLSLGIVWSPCAGPILAAIATLAATGQVSLNVIFVTIAYVLGIGVPLFIFALAGQQIFTKTRAISSKTHRIQQVFGLIMIVTAIAIYTNYDTYLQAQLLNAFPFFNSTIDKFETNSVVKQQLDVLKGQQPSDSSIYDTGGLFNTDTAASDFGGGTKWLNSPQALSLKDLKGKVILVDFWTYTCINCIRTLPHVTSWYDKYNKQGFVVIGVHTPEFQFEHETKNVEAAIKQYNIHYPVVQDNNYTIWNRYNNQYWPAEYLIDATGVIRRVEFGEGNYDETEKAIQELLKEAGKKVTESLDTMPDTTPHIQLSPETYLGTNRAQFYYPGGGLTNGNQTYTLTETPPQDSFSLGGTWNIDSENATAGNKATLTYTFYADKVFLVLRPGSTKNAQIKVFLDGKTIDSTQAGDDVKNGIVTVDSDRLYDLINLHGQVGTHTLKLKFLTPGIQAFAFTFG
jgi:cytochrome c biogenesis protein CcdA/thiol-disulfide isomerase/thioredoxin